MTRALTLSQENQPRRYVFPADQPGDRTRDPEPKKILEDWKRKWLRRLDSSGTAAGMRSARTRQLDLFKQAHGDESKERDLYGRLHKVSERQKQLLLTLGLMKVIRLDPAMLLPGE